MIKQLIFVLTGVLALVLPAFASSTESLPIELQLASEIFGPRWGLSANESDMLLDKLRIAQERSDYEKALVDLYSLAKNFTPKPFDPSLWHDDEDAVFIEPTHRVLVDNPYVRILEVVMSPGCHQAYHTHQWAGITFDLISSDFILYNNSGEFMLYATDDPVWHHDEGQPLHRVTNIGDTTYIGLHFEFKN